MTAPLTARFTHWLQSVFSIQSGEGLRVAVMILYSAATVGGVLTIGTTVGDTLFISGQPASAFPYLLILPAVFIIPILLIYNRIAARLRLDQIIIGSNVLLLAGTVLFRFLLDTPLGKSFWVVVALYLFVEVAYTITILQFWSLAGQVFNAREAKRLFGLIAVGGTFANIIAGLSLAAVVNLIGVENLLWLVVAALGVCMACTRALSRPTPDTTSRPASQPSAKKPRPTLWQDLRAIGQSPLLLAIGLITILISLLINVGGYTFYLSLQLNFAGQPEALATYLGAFHFIGGLTGFIVQSYLTAWLMKRFGVFAGLALFPLGMALGAAFSLLTGGALWAMTILRIVDPVFRRTINAAALNVLYLPTPANVRDRAKEIFETSYAAAFGLVGVVLLFLQNIPAWNFLYNTLPLLIMALLWLALLPRARRQYTAALVNSLKRRVLDLEGATLNISDKTTARILRESLKHSDEMYILHALQLIAGATDVNWDADVASLLRHPSPTIRLRAVGHLGRRGNIEYAASITTLTQDPEAEVRAAAIEALSTVAAATEKATLTSAIVPFLNDADSRVKGKAIVGLLKHGAPDQVERATAELNGLLASEDSGVRAEGARAIGVARGAATGAAASPALAALLIPLFDDASLEVRLNAIRAAGQLSHHDLLSHLIRKLNDKTTTSAAVAALIRYRDDIDADLSAALETAESSASHIPHILQDRRTRSAVESLLTHFYTADETVRGEIYRALGRLRSEGAEFYLPEARLREALASELRRGYEWIVVREDLGQEGLDILLADALQVRLNRAIDRVFYLLHLLYPRYTGQIQRVRGALGAEGGNTRAMAVELLDNLAERQTKELLLPLVESPVETILEVARKRFDIERRSRRHRLKELAEGPDLWLRACAIFRIGTLKRTELADNVRAALDSNDLLLRETALLASRALNLQSFDFAQDRLPTSNL